MMPYIFRSKVCKERLGLSVLLGKGSLWKTSIFLLKDRANSLTKEYG